MGSIRALWINVPAVQAYAPSEWFEVVDPATEVKVPLPL